MLVNTENETYGIANEFGRIKVSTKKHYPPIVFFFVLYPTVHAKKHKDGCVHAEIFASIGIYVSLRLFKVK